MKAAYTLLFFQLVLQYTFAQEYPRKQNDLQDLSDNYVAYQDDDINYEDLYENLAQLRAHPRDLNKITSEELRSLQFLNESQVESIISHRSSVGKFLSTYELQAVDGLDLNTVYQLAPYVYVPDASTIIDRSLLQRMKDEGDHYFMIRYGSVFQKKEGFSDDDHDRKFLGSPEKLYLRFRSSRPGDFSAGFTLEKDEGERVRWAPDQKQYGFDYCSFHLQLQNKGRIRNLVLGDFQCQFGQGLILGGGFGMGKGGETIMSIRRSNIGLMPFTSVYEAGALRGGAATILLTKTISLTGLYSLNFRDANVDDSGNEMISTFQTTGLHRNEKEFSMRHQVREQNSGIILQYQKNNIDGGIILHHLQYDHALKRTPTAYNQFTFSGNANTNAGVFLNYTFQQVSFFSEAAYSIHGGYGIVAGLLCSVHPKVDVSVLTRIYQRDFYGFFGNGFSENTTTQNERGIYWGWKYRMNRKFTASGYADLFYFPWVKFRSYRPSSGHEWLLRGEYTPSRKVRLLLQLREEQKIRNLSEESNLYKTDTGTKRNLVISSDYGIGQKLRLKTRAQFSSYRFSKTVTKGMALAQDVCAEAGRFEFTGRYVVFDTDDFDNRQYSYEKDVWLAYSLPAYYGRGVRQAFMIEYKMNRRWSFWLRLTQTRYIDRDAIGTSLESIDGNILNDIKIQARLKL